MIKQVLHLAPMTSCLGAVVTDVDPDRDGSVELRDALDRWRVLIVAGARGGVRSLESLAAIWDAEVAVEHGSPIFDAGLGAGHWTIDSSSQATPPCVVIARCECAPAAGGDTVWCDLAAAYERLSPPLQAIAETLVATHISAESTADHPVVRVDAGGRLKSLY